VDKPPHYMTASGLPTVLLPPPRPTRSGTIKIESDAGPEKATGVSAQLLECDESRCSCRDETWRRRPKKGAATLMTHGSGASRFPPSSRDNDRRVDGLPLHG
jgi:hypothetical protein